LTYPIPHLEKLAATLANEKLPDADRVRVEAAIERYRSWIKEMAALKGATPERLVEAAVALLNDYRNYIDLELIFDSEDDFLYRQKGQLKLDNSVIEEFLPWLINPVVIPELKGLAIEVGPIDTFAAVYFASDLANELPGGGLGIRTKAQDFAVARRLYLRASHTPDFANETRRDTFITYVASECKTNLDKTMFQEACATAHDVKAAVAGARYYLLCEWLDMAPLSTAATDIDEVLILRKAKRINSNVRAKFATSAKRRTCREEYTAYLKGNPFRPEIFLRYVDHIRRLLKEDAPPERVVLDQGFF
jgi:Bpu10I-like restriction endonuclease